MNNNQTKISDFAYLAEAAYVDYYSISDTGQFEFNFNADAVQEYIKRKSADSDSYDPQQPELPDSYAKFITKNYQVVAHHVDRGDWSI